MREMWMWKAQETSSKQFGKYAYQMHTFLSYLPFSNLCNSNKKKCIIILIIII